jgi:hypothetical protein
LAGVLPYAAAGVGSGSSVKRSSCSISVMPAPVSMPYSFRTYARVLAALWHSVSAGCPAGEILGQGPFLLAVGVGFEPTVTRATTVFKTATGLRVEVSGTDVR